MKNAPARLVYLERFAHPVALELLAARPHIEARCLERSWDSDRLWSEFAAAHVYQIRATRSEFDGATPDRTRYQVGIGLNREFSKNFSGRIDARHITQDSDEPNLNYDENRITLMLNKYF